MAPRKKADTRKIDCDQFYMDLYDADDLAAMEVICEQMWNNVYEAYPLSVDIQKDKSIAMRHQWFTKLRAVVDSLEFAEIGEDEKEKLKKKLLKTPEEIKVRVKRDDNAADVKSSNRPDIDPELCIVTANALLNSGDAWNIALGLIMLTGRRETEIFKTAEFRKLEIGDDITRLQTPTGGELPELRLGDDIRQIDLLVSPQFPETLSDRVVMFKGQLKKRTGVDDTEIAIPVLGNIDNIIQALAKVRRAFPQFQNMTPDQVKKEVATKAGRLSKQEFPFIPPTMIVETGGKSLKEVSPKQLRAAYIQIGYRHYCPRRTGERFYYKMALGHAPASKSTWESYDVYLCEDSPKRPR